MESPHCPGRRFCEVRVLKGNGIVERPQVALEVDRRRPEVKFRRGCAACAQRPGRPQAIGTGNEHPLPDPPDCEFDFVNGVTNILFHQYPINIAGHDTTDTLPHFPSSFLWIKEALFPVLTAVIPVLLPLREVGPELACLPREERVYSKIQPVPYDLCTHSEQEPYTISKRQGDLVPVPCCCRGTAMCN